MKKTLPQVLDVCIFSYFRYLLKCFAESYRARYGINMLVYLCVGNSKTVLASGDYFGYILTDYLEWTSKHLHNFIKHFPNARHKKQYI